jgi:hypothetical protein
MKTKLPKCNGRPQLWYEDYSAFDGLMRIIYPDGTVETYNSAQVWVRSCLSQDSQEEALEYFDGTQDLFLGYL